MESNWEERQRKEIESDKKFARYLYIGLAIYIIVGLKACGTDSPYGEGCYDADPTQYVDVYCE